MGADLWFLLARVEKTKPTVNMHNQLTERSWLLLHKYQETHLLLQDHCGVSASVANWVKIYVHAYLLLWCDKERDDPMHICFTLALDRWSRPTITVPISMVSRAFVGFVHLSLLTVVSRRKCQIRLRPFCCMWRTSAEVSIDLWKVDQI